MKLGFPGRMKKDGRRKRGELIPRESCNNNYCKAILASPQRASGSVSGTSMAIIFNIIAILQCSGFFLLKDIP